MNEHISHGSRCVREGEDQKLQPRPTGLCLYLRGPSQITPTQPSKEESPTSTDLAEDRG